MQDAEVSSSPLPVEEKEPEVMSFYKALDKALTGSRIQRKAWPEDEYGYFIGDFLHIHKDNKDHTWILSKGDVIEEDYIVF